MRNGNNAARVIGAALLIVLCAASCDKKQTVEQAPAGAVTLTAEELAAIKEQAAADALAAQETEESAPAEAAQAETAPPAPPPATERVFTETAGLVEAVNDLPSNTAESPYTITLSGADISVDSLIDTFKMTAGGYETPVNNFVNLDLSACTGITDSFKLTEFLVNNIRIRGFALPDTMETIAENSASGGFISSLTLPANLKTIGARAFSYCESLTEITIPAGVTEIGANAFADCTGLTQVIFAGDTPPKLGAGAFSGGNAAMIFIPPYNEAAVAAYTEAFGGLNPTALEKKRAAEAEAVAKAQAEAAKPAYKVGDTGPGGGTVFYVKNGKGLEAIQTDGAVAVKTNFKRESDNRWKINGFSNWRLPAKNEAQYLYQTLLATGLVNFGEGWMWCLDTNGDPLALFPGYSMILAAGGGAQAGVNLQTGEYTPEISGRVIGVYVRNF
jgi:hypothetical protein